MYGPINYSYTTLALALSQSLHHDWHYCRLGLVAQNIP